MIGEFVILRSRDDGVVCGRLKSLVPQPGGLFAAEVEDARIIHHWQQNNENYTLFELAMHGVRPPATARISEAVSLHMMGGVCGVTPCTAEAQQNLSQSRWNKPYEPSASTRATGRNRGS
jgi:hypothetical protein